MPTPDERLPEGYRLRRELSRSERGLVVEAEHDGQRVVLRVLGGTGPDRPFLEAPLGTRLGSRGLVPPSGWGRLEDGRPWLARPFVDGQPLDQALAGAAEEACVGWVVALLETLADLHDAGLLHRDIKASNILVNEEGPWLVDLDLLAREQGGDAAGSPLHLAPELISGSPNSVASDLFALGATLAYALAGPPHTDFDLRFPREDFWTASRLDPSKPGPLLGPLIRALVRRHPSDRPHSARQAADLLDAGAGATPPRTAPPFLLGREEPFERLMRTLRTDAAAGCGAVFVLVDAPDEVEPLLEAVSLGLGSRGIPSARPTVGAGPGDEAAYVLIDAGDLTTASAEVAEGLSRGQATRLVVAGSPGETSALVEALRQRGMEDELPEISREHWPPMREAAVARHLRQITDDSNPTMAEALAETLHTRTLGSHPRLVEHLARAESLEVLRCDGSRWALLRGDWPEVDDAPPDLSDLDPDGRALLAALAVLEDRNPPPPTLAARVAALEHEDSRRALARLRTGGWIVDRPGAGVRVRSASILAQLTGSERHALHARALESLRDQGAPPERTARHAIFLAQDAEGILEALSAWDEAFEAGRLVDLKALLETAASHPLADAVVERACARRLARLELAQGHVEQAWLAVAQVADRDDADPETLLAAAHAAEQSSRREEARGLNERVLEGGEDRATRLRAVAGLAYADIMDGAPEAALGRTDAVRDDDADAAAAMVLSARAVALMHLSRFEEARPVLEEAHRRAERSGSPGLVARTQLNRSQYLRRTGAPHEAVAALEGAEQAFTRAGVVHGRALAANSLGVLQRDLGRMTLAREHLTRALSLHRRAGDRHGAAVSLANLTAVELESGCIGTALETGRRAADELAAIGHKGELGFVEAQLAMAGALQGEHDEALRLLTGPAVTTLAESRPGLVARARALVHALTGETAEALGLLRRALTGTTDAAERFRAAALMTVVAPDPTEGRRILHEGAEALQSAERDGERRWRVEAEVDTGTLDAWLAVFDAAGRTDLARATARRLAELHDAAGRVGPRRAASARAARATDALLDGLAPDQHERVMRRLDWLAGAASEASGEGLSLDWLLTVNRRLAREDDLEALLLAIVDAGLELTRARRGFLVLREGDESVAHVARGMEHDDLQPEAARFSQSVVQRAMDAGEPLLTSDAASDERFSGTASIAALSLRSVLCVPLLGPQGPIGALYLDDDVRREAFDERDVARVVALADQAATTVGHVRRRAEVEALNARLADRVEHQAAELEEARRALRRRGSTSPVAGLVGESDAMRAVYDLVDRVAPTDLPILVTGPSGSGKDIVSRALHERSHRASGPLVVENVAAVPATLLESELFGHARGAFTGADRDRPGLFAEADGGTFVLDEIGELPLELQPKLLRVLETGEVRAVGARRPRKVDVRIIAATNRDLLERVGEGAFREDLYYRLNGVEVRLPGLEDRLGDIPLLVQHFLDRMGEKHEKPKSIDDAVLSALVARSWPGQVRELSNEVARLYYLSDEVIDDAALVRSPGSAGDDAEGVSGSLRLEDAEREAVIRAMKAAGGRKDRAAQLLGISRTGLYAKLKRLGVGADEGTRD